VNSLDGKTAIVTGAGRGIGRAIALAFARAGADVGVLEIDDATARSTADEIAALGRKAVVRSVDIGKRASAIVAIDDIARQFGRLDILVNNAMWIRYEPMADIAEETIDRMLAVGFKAPVWCMQAAAPHLEDSGGGAIINISSPASEIGLPNALIYCGIKGGVLSMTRSASAELGKHGIRVCAIAPGPMHTAGAETIVDKAGYEKRLRRTPLQRLGSPEDIARTAVFLASDDADFISGDMIHVDGGMTFAFLE
jgi:3-oxoacyl-[acyl-carrier protein] reductase